MTNDLVRLTEAAQMLAEARTLPDIRKVHNLAQRAQDYAKAARLGLDAQNSAAAIRLEAEAKAGELLRVMRESGERATGHAPLKVASQPAIPPATLDDLGVTPDESSRWQAVAQVPPEVRAEYVAASNEREEEVTRAGLLRHARAAEEHTFGAAMSARDAALTPAMREDEARSARRVRWTRAWAQIMDGIARLEWDAVDDMTATERDTVRGHAESLRRIAQRIEDALGDDGIRLVKGGKR